MREHMLSQMFTPYRRGQGPAFIVRLYDTGKTRDGKHVVAYTLEQRQNKDGVHDPHTQEHNEIIFEGDDYCCSPLHAIDSNESVESLMSFLTVREGDTDSEYFDGYTERQIEFRDEHAEALGFEVTESLNSRRTLED